MMYHTFDTPSSFAERLTAFLAKWVRDHETSNGVTKKSGTIAAIPIDEKPATRSDRLRAITEHLERAEELASGGNTTEAELIYSRLVAQGNSPEAMA